MNLRSWTTNGLAGGRAARRRAPPRPLHFFKGTFGQNVPMRLISGELPMSLSFARKAAICFCWGLFLALPAVVFGQTNYYTTNGMEYAIAGSLPGDQVWPDVAAGTNGGFVVWQDNATDGSGSGVSAQRLDATLSGTLSAFRVNVQGTNDQENARVALLKNGGAAFVWQGGVKGFPAHLRALFEPHQHLADHHGRGGERAHQQLSNQSRRGRAEQQQRRGRVEQFRRGGFQQHAGRLRPDVLASRPENRRRISGQPVHGLQPAHAGRGGAGQWRLCRRLGFGTAADGGGQSGEQHHRLPGCPARLDEAERGHLRAALQQQRRAGGQ